MSFTADELQSLNDILDKKLSGNLREMERVFDQRFQVMRREFEQRLTSVQQEIIRIITNKLTEQQHGLNTSFHQELTTQQMAITQSVSSELRQHQQQQQPLFEGIVDRALAAQLLALEELLNQRLVPRSFEDTAVYDADHPSQFETIEVQTELPWEDLMDVFGKAFDERFSALQETTLAMTRNWEQNLSAQIRRMQSQLHEEFVQRRPTSYNGNLTNLQEVFQSIEQLERIIESMQVAMTANHALLSNRLYNHQQQPVERAHHTTHSSGQHQQPQLKSSGGINNSLPPSKERQEQ